MVVYIHCNHVDHKMLSYLVVLFYDCMAGSSVGIEFMKCQRVSLASHISKMKFFFLLMDWILNQLMFYANDAFFFGTFDLAFWNNTNATIDAASQI